jgi:Kef-type K+ transport system membrane component KefB
MNQATAGAAHFFLQLVVILSACALMRALMRRIGQSPVVGEMIAGVLLGPSLQPPPSECPAQPTPQILHDFNHVTRHGLSICSCG